MTYLIPLRFSLRRTPYSVEFDGLQEHSPVTIVRELPDGTETRVPVNFDRASRRLRGAIEDAYSAACEEASNDYEIEHA